MKRISLCILLLIASSVAEAQVHTLKCNSSQACVAWTPTPGWSNGSAYAPGTSIAYNVYVQQENKPPVLRGNTTGLEIRIVGLPPGKYFFFVRALVNGVESGNSNVVPKVIRFPGPTDGAIEAPSDGAIEEPIF